MTPFQPALVAEVELAEDLRLSPPDDPRDATKYERAIALVRLHTRPIGVVEIERPPTALDAAALAEELWPQVQDAVNAHLHADGLPPLGRLLPTGVAVVRPPCVERRERALASAPPLSVVVPTHNRPAVVAATLQSILRLRYPRFEVVVVDNAPRDRATQDLVASLDRNGVELTYVREERPGASRARNIGAARASADHVAFADDDVLVDEHWLAGLWDGFAATADVGCVTGPIVPLHIETEADAWMLEYADFRTGFEREVFDLREHRSPRPLYPYNPGVFGSGGSMAFTKDALREIGGFDESLGPATRARAGEELAAFLAVVLRGRRIVFEPSALVWHADSLTYEALRRRVYAYGVGLTAYLTKSTVDRPRIALDLLGRLPAALYLSTSSRSPKKTRRSPTFPSELDSIERRGMLAGPLAYLRGRLRTRRHGAP